MRERTVESELCRCAREAAGKAMKWVSPGSSGVVDRLVFLPGGRVVLVELKAPRKKPRPLQARHHAQMRALGFTVVCLDTVEKVRAFAAAGFTE